MSEEQEQKLNIGKKLKDARVANGFTLDDLQQATKIQKRYLIAIEDENFDELPGDFYVRAFIKQYANTVGLNGNDLLKEYDDYLPKTKTADYSEHLNEAVEPRRSGNRRNAVARIDGLRKYLPTIIISVIVLVILAAIWVTAIARNHRDSSKIDSSSVSVSGESSKKKTTSSFKKSSKKDQEIKLTESSRTANAVAYRSTKALSKATNLQITTTGTSTNSVIVDGTTRLSRTMGTNNKQTVALAKNARSITIRIGNARVTKIKFGNQTLDITNHNRYPATRVVTILLGSQTNHSSSSSVVNDSRMSNSQTRTATQTSRTGQTTTQRSNGTVTRQTTTSQQSSRQ
ncbi:RodZ domain-containing protein [uncultured Limosilactobacillus sp.]|uniref:helix-turn-helix domain-containing protein n=1 Tax=uncultured Limosilactobacillus sp. TaxID=2837629 RepID=UPI0025F076FD|nr:RodZ domain-containing protein [uncultured Limosilactobacillus sp.]